MAVSAISPRSTAWRKMCWIRALRCSRNWCCRASLSSGWRDASTSTARMVLACWWTCWPQISPDLQQIAPQRAGVRRDRDLTDALVERGQHQFGFRGPAAVHGGLAGAGGAGHRVHRQPVVAVLLQELQRHRQQLGLPRRPRRQVRDTVGCLGHSAHDKPKDCALRQFSAASGGPSSRSCRNPSSSRTGTPSSTALSYFDPGESPATT